MVKKEYLVLIIACIFIAGIGLVASWSKQDSSLKTVDQNQQDRIVQLRINSASYQVVLADTEQKRTQGLSGRVQLPQDGMVFVFAQSGYHSFWMKEMLFDLDFIWIDDGKVVDITRNVPKPATEALPIYQPKVPASMMWEAVAGFADQQSIEIGDSVEIIQ